MEVKTQNQISHDSWYKERGHSSKTLTREQLKEELLEYDSTLDVSKIGLHLTAMSSQMGMKKNDFLRQVVAYEYPNYQWEKDNFSLRDEFKELVREVLDEIKAKE